MVDKITNNGIRVNHVSKRGEKGINLEVGLSKKSSGGMPRLHEGEALDKNPEIEVRRNKITSSGYIDRTRDDSWRDSHDETKHVPYYIVYGLFSVVIPFGAGFLKKFGYNHDIGPVKNEIVLDINGGHLFQAASYAVGTLFPAVHQAGIDSGWGIHECYAGAAGGLVAAVSEALGEMTASFF